jgi:hypothetical protein
MVLSYLAMAYYVIGIKKGMELLCRIASHQGSACDGGTALVYESLEYFKGSRKISGAYGTSKTLHFQDHSDLLKATIFQNRLEN